MDQKFGRPDRNRNQRILVPYVAFRPPTSDAHWHHEPDCAPASWSAAVLCRFGKARVPANTPWRVSGHVRAIQKRQRAAALQNLAEVRPVHGTDGSLSPQGCIKLWPTRRIRSAEKERPGFTPAL